MSLTRVLHLPKWYPHGYDDQDGDFVARHVAAIAQAAPPSWHPAVLLATVARSPIPGLVVCEESLTDPVPTLRYYYRARLTGVPPLDKLLKLGLYYWCLARGYRRLQRHWGARPDLVHVHVLLRTGLWAWWQRWRHGIPYLITEHWTLYLPERAGHISWLRARLTRLVVRRAATLHTVSESLRDAMAGLGFTNPRSVVLANVVDTDLFCPAPAPREFGRLLVVSAFHEPVKNISGILRVVARLRPQWPALRLRLAGYGPDEPHLRRLAAELGLLADGTVAFLGKLPHPAVASEMQRAAALVSFSRAETFGCVLLEARATGCPVIGPATGGVPELFQPAGTFGVLVPPDDEAALTRALTDLLQGRLVVDANLLRTDAERRCGYAQVGRQFITLYTSLLPEAQRLAAKTDAS
ncbi:glycosyltransferase [Hymenobacter sp. HSC-4F20]|uniref:glycosyltransferase n=1 Tax=Hymenobacter sp. HSC-4F20 TaxID=2864135 RepID=UPI001C729D35|nr:glycosyltransferase [Hymenobacter sp. HSC-4F20]MBX0291373.1 glycosyltransferase [Hymenobacter sp. HSC-4F20]